MALPRVTQQNTGYGTTPPPVVINIHQQNTPVVTMQPAPRELEAQQPRGGSSFLGRMVEKITQSRRYKRAVAFTDSATKPLREWAIDFGGALKILGKETWKGVSYGALAGLGTGGVITFLCPPLMGPAFTASITAGVTAGGIIGYLCGVAKASDYFEAACQARRDAAEAVKQQHPKQLAAVTQQFEALYV